MTINDRIFPDPTEVLSARQENVDTVKVFRSLVHVVKQMLNLWKDPEQPTFGKVNTRNRRAAEMLIDALRTDGYAADYHWHGSFGVGCELVVQFAPAEAGLQRAHHDPRR